MLHRLCVHVGRPLGKAEYVCLQCGACLCIADESMCTSHAVADVRSARVAVSGPEYQH